MEASYFSLGSSHPNSTVKQTDPWIIELGSESEPSTHKKPKFV